MELTQAQARRKVYYSENKEQILAYRKRWTRSMRGRHSKVKSTHSKHWRDFTGEVLSFSEYEHKMLAGMCNYCKGPLNETGSGLDRVDSRVGYTNDNTVACCSNCNQQKSNLTRCEYQEIWNRRRDEHDLGLDPWSHPAISWMVR